VASTSAPVPVGDVWGRSERTASWDKLPHSVEEQIKECSKIAAGE
jgi:hypothetical protein